MINPKKQRKRARKIRAFTIAQKNRCAYCKVSFTEKESTWDHILPASLGGTRCITNVVLVCQDCNTKKGGQNPHLYLTPEIWRRIGRIHAYVLEFYSKFS